MTTVEFEDKLPKLDDKHGTIISCVYLFVDAYTNKPGVAFNNEAHDKVKQYLTETLFRKDQSVEAAELLNKAMKHIEEAYGRIKEEFKNAGIPLY